MFRHLASLVLLRRVIRDIHRLADAVETQTALLARLADHYAPILPTEPTLAHRAGVRADTGVTHLDPVDAGLALDFVARTAQQTGHTPDDEEILIYLADEKTHDLAARLTARDDELARLMEERR